MTTADSTAVNAPKVNTQKVSYLFNFPNVLKKQFDVIIDRDSFEITRTSKQELPEWTALDYKKCTHCPLNSKDTPRCPIAVNLYDLVNFFSDKVSYEKVTVVVLTESRNFQKETDLQDGIQSLFGLVMASSGCPHMNFLKPMAFFHLPFSQLDEAIGRSISMYLLQEHYLAFSQPGYEVNFKKLESNYADVNQVNQGIAQRFQGLKLRDSSKNGLIILDAFASMLPWEFAEGFKRFDFLFNFKHTYSK